MRTHWQNRPEPRENRTFIARSCRNQTWLFVKRVKPGHLAPKAYKSNGPRNREIHMSQQRSGRCACGNVTYKLSDEPKFSFHCQCRDCQRATGGGHASAFVMSKDHIEIEGEIKYFERPATSGNSVRQGFCPTCGSPTLNHNSGFPDSVFIHAATLDNPELFKPQKVVYREHSLSWDFVDPELP